MFNVVAPVPPFPTANVFVTPVARFTLASAAIKSPVPAKAAVPSSLQPTTSLPFIISDVASEACSLKPLIVKASKVTVPSKNASLNSKELVPKSIWLLVTGYKAEDVRVNLAALSALKSISFAVPKSIAVWESSPIIKSVA